MTTYQSFYDQQLTAEAKKYTVDFSDFLGSASLVSGSTSYAQTYGGSASGSATTVVAGGSLATFTTPALSAAGLYTFTTSVTLSDAQVRKALYVIRVDA